MEKEVRENKSKAKIAIDIITYVIVIFLFICSLSCLIIRLNGSSFTIFGNRYDVVLTDSMATKNAAHADFLKDDNNQFKPFDLAISKPLPKSEEIKEHDVVIYTDKIIGTNMHRVVEIDTNYSEKVTFTYSSLAKINEQNGVSLKEVESQLLTNDITFTTMTFTTYSLSDKFGKFNFYVVDNLYTPEISQTKDEYGGYFTTYKIKRDSSQRGSIKISHSSIYDYSREIVTGFHVDSKMGEFDVDVNNLIPSVDDEVSYTQVFNKQYIYKTRGDAAKDDDGWSTYADLQAIVVGNAPGMGYPLRYLGSIWGGLMFAFLAILILVVDILKNKKYNKEKAVKK